MDDTQGPTPAVDRRISGPLSREAAAALLNQGAALLESGEFPEALATYQRVVGFDDPEVTAAALLGMAQSRYRMDDENGALSTWEAILAEARSRIDWHACDRRRCGRCRRVRCSGRTRRWYDWRRCWSARPSNY